MPDVEELLGIGPAVSFGHGLLWPGTFQQYAVGWMPGACLGVAEFGRLLRENHVILDYASRCRILELAVGRGAQIIDFPALLSFVEAVVPRRAVSHWQRIFELRVDPVEGGGSGCGGQSRLPWRSYKLFSTHMTGTAKGSYAAKTTCASCGIVGRCHAHPKSSTTCTGKWHSAVRMDCQVRWISRPSSGW